MTRTSIDDSPEQQAAADERRRFLEMIDREMRTPLNGVLAVAQLLARQPLTADAQAYVRTIVETSDGLIRRLGQALDLATGQCGALATSNQTVELRALMDEVQADWQARSTPGVTLLVSYDGEPDLAAVVDGARLRQMFDVLIGKALEAASRGAVEASLRARLIPEGILLEGRVRDSGASQSRDPAALFEAGASRNLGGGGLSLPLCREIARAMGGDIRAEANAGAGLSVIFTVTAPRAEADAKEEAGLASGGSAHVLVVDDNATNRMVAESLCEMFDCTSESVEDGVEAVEAAKSGRFDLILMDIKMPRMDGVEATRCIRSLPGRAGQVPIIALTANADPEDAKGYVASGMSSVVEKPIKPDRLLAAMNEAFEVAAGLDGARAA